MSQKTSKTKAGAERLTYCPRARAEEKRRSREQDAEDLRTGKKTAEELRAENGKFAFPDAVIDWKSVKRLW